MTSLISLFKRLLFFVFDENVLLIENPRGALLFDNHGRRPQAFTVRVQIFQNLSASTNQAVCCLPSPLVHFWSTVVVGAGLDAVLDSSHASSSSLAPLFGCAERTYCGSTAQVGAGHAKVTAAANVRNGCVRWAEGAQMEAGQGGPPERARSSCLWFGRAEATSARVKPPA